MYSDNVLKKLFYNIKMISEGKAVLSINCFSKNQEINSFLKVKGIKIIDAENIKSARKCKTLFIIITTLDELNDFKNNFAEYKACFSENLLIWVENKKINFNDLEVFLFENNMRKHSLYYEFNYYGESRDHLFGVYAKLNEKNDKVLSLMRMQDEANLYLDMSRVNGIRSAGHIIRYKIASDYIRIGDVVLDCACGLGYGSDILANSAAQKVIGVDYSDFAIEYASNIFNQNKCSFVKADAQNLAFLEDNSIDFVAAFETLEHIPQPEKFLEEVFRVLKPSGRIMLSVPNNWADESGKDPNPEHLHVYGEEKLYQQISKRFLPELKWALTMNRYFNKGKEYSSNSFLCKYALEENLPKETECILYLAMKDPLLGREIPYQESSWGTYGDGHVLLNFKKYYSNPFLIKGFQSYGVHENLTTRKAIANKILDTYEINTPEYGGALCFLGYRELERENLSLEFKSLSDKIDEYINKNDDNNLHIFRWKISLAYLMGCICLKNNNIALGKKYFSFCINNDITKFSPTLGTKIISAYRYLADLSVNVDEKKLYWKKSLETMQSYFASKNWINIIGDLDRPFPIGLEEMKTILNLAEKSAWDIVLNENQVANKFYGLREELKALYINEQNEGLKDQLEQINNKYDLMQQKKIILENECNVLRNELFIMQSSRSWKATSLLRKIGQGLRKIKNIIKNLNHLCDKDFKKVLSMVKEKKNKKGTICIFSPMYNEENLKDGYYRRVNALDQIFNGYLKIHINTVGWDNRKLKVEYYADDVINIAYDPGSVIQVLQLRLLLLLSGRMYTHSIWQMKDWALNFPFVKKFVDLHGVVPEEYRLYGDYISAQEADDVEEQVVQKVDYMIAVTDAMREHMIEKYKDKVKADFILMPIYEEQFGSECEEEKILVNSKPVVVYAGGTQKWQLIPEMQDAMISTSADVHFEICVPVPNEFFAIWNERSPIKNMTVESRTHDEVLEIYKHSHYGFVLREDIAVNNVACPTKLVEYIENDIIPILSTPKVGDFYKMGMEYITLQDFIDGKLPVESERAVIARKNRLILKICKKQYLAGKENLLERMK